MKQIGRGLLVSVLILMLLTGCWNRRELNELGVLMGTAIDKVGKEFQVSVQVVVPDQVSSRGGSKGNTPVTLFKATAPTLFEAFRKLTETSPRKIYTGHIRVLVVSESVAKEGISKVLDLLTRNPESRADYYVMIANGTSAANVLKILTPLEKVPAEAIFNSLFASSREWAPTTRVTADQLIEQMTSEGINPVLTGIKIIEDEPKDKTGEMKKVDTPVKLSYSGLAAFKKDKLVGWLNNNESKGYNYILNNVRSTVGHLTCPDGNYIVLEIIQSHTDVKGRIEHGKPNIKVEVKMEANIGEVACKIDLTDPETINMLQEMAEHELKNLMEQAVEVMQIKYKVDIFGFGQAIYRSDPKAWKQLKENWDEQFAALKVDYKPEVHIRNIGTTSKSIESSMKGK